MVEESPASPNAPKSHTNPKSSILIGTSGYDYPEWKGVFYPPEVKRADFLSYYATQFNALELNNTFYNMPTAERLLSFYERSEGRLQFSVKANRLLTHEVTSEWQKSADDFKQALSPLLEKASLSAVLFQFPQNFHYTPDNRIYLANLIEDFEAFPVLIEFRHAGWIRESVFEGLEKRGAGLVYCDMPMCRKAQTSIISNYANGAQRRMPQLRNLPDGKTVKSPFIGPNAYIRLHGRNAGAWYAHDAGPETNGSARYCYDYSDSELESFVPVISKAMSEGKKTQVFFNNHPDGSGAKNAKRLKDLLAPIP